MMAMGVWRPPVAPEIRGPRSALSGERDSLLRCVGGVGEAGASYMNKGFNYNLGSKYCILNIIFALGHNDPE